MKIYRSFARLDGGPIEVAKGFISMWDHIQQIDSIIACTDFYSERVLEKIKQCGFDAAWITWSAGFSIEQEEYQWEILMPFIKKMKEIGISPIAYISLTNIFKQEMFERKPESKEWIQVGPEGKPVPYGAAAYEGEPKRILACLNNPAWLDYCKTRIDTALAAGCEGIFYDNLFHSCYCRQCRKAYEEWTKKRLGRGILLPHLKLVESTEESKKFAMEEVSAAQGSERKIAFELFNNHTIATALKILKKHAERQKANLIFMCNAHQRPDLNEVCSALSTEDGTEPGMKDGIMRSNIGLYRVLYAQGGGRRPMFVECGHRIFGQRTIVSCGRDDGPMDDTATELAIYEAGAMGGALESYFEGHSRRMLYFSEPAMMRNLEVIGKANAWVKQNPELFGNFRPLAKTLILTDGYPGDLLMRLTQEGLIYAVAKFAEITTKLLAAYKQVIFFQPGIIEGGQIEAITRFIESGGKALLVAASGEIYDENLRPISLPEMAIFQSHCDEESYNMTDLIRTWRQNEEPPYASIPPGLHIGPALAEKDKKTRYLYLLNYAKKEIPEVSVTYSGLGQPKEIITPAGRERCTGKLLIPNLGLFAAIRFEAT